MTKKQAMAERKKRLRKRRRRRALIIVLELIILAGLSVVAYGMMKLDKMEQTSLDETKLDIYQDTGDYTNIALFGLDSREEELEGGVQSDCMMIASINNSTGEVKLVSVYRDTLLQQEDGGYGKANSAYTKGGPQEAIALMNRNLDLDIQKYISVNFNALADVVDALGGIDLEMTEEEVYWTNGYCTETSKVVGRKTTELSGAGEHHVDGIQAVSYARIRYTSGDDFKRTERQRIVLEKVVQKAKKAKLTTLNKILDEVLPQVSTNLTAANFMGIAANAMNYELGDMCGFPFTVTASEKVKNHKGSFVVPVGLEKNVRELHQFLFGEETYVPSEHITTINDEIIYLSGVDPETYKHGMDVSYREDEDTKTDGDKDGAEDTEGSGEE